MVLKLGDNRRVGKHYADLEIVREGSRRQVRRANEGAAAIDDQQLGV